MLAGLKRFSSATRDLRLTVVEFGILAATVGVWTVSTRVSVCARIRTGRVVIVCGSTTGHVVFGGGYLYGTSGIPEGLEFWRSPPEAPSVPAGPHIGSLGVSISRRAHGIGIAGIICQIPCWVCFGAGLLTTRAFRFIRERGKWDSGRSGTDRRSGTGKEGKADSKKNGGTKRDTGQSGTRAVSGSQSGTADKAGQVGFQTH